MKTLLVITYILLAGLIVLVFLSEQKINTLKRDIIKLQAAAGAGNTTGTTSPHKEKQDITAGELIELIKEKLNEKSSIIINA